MHASSPDGLLLASTLDGNLHALDANTGTIKWTLQDDPVVKNPKESSKSSIAQFFPNPRDGSLYRYTLGTSEHPLKKLPFTIPQLVENSPCRSTDGLFYLGKKVDSFTVVHRSTGDKQLVLGMQSVLEQCARTPAIPRSESLFIGRTMYNVMLYEQNTGHRWNVTFYDYTTTSDWQEEDYGLVHYAGAGSSTLMTLDKATESLMWTADLDSPIVALFTITSDGNLMSVPMTVVAFPTLQRYIREILRRGSFLLTTQSHQPIQQLSPSIYLGESSLGSTYVMPSLVDDQMATIKRRPNPRLLLDGPDASKSPDSDHEKQQAPPASPTKFDFDRSSEEYASSSANPFSRSSSNAHSEAANSDEVHESKPKIPEMFDDDFPVASQSYRIEDGLFAHCKIDEFNNPEDVVVLGHYTVPDQLPEDMFPSPSDHVPLGITYLRETEGSVYTGDDTDYIDSDEDYIDADGGGQHQNKKRPAETSSDKKPLVQDDRTSHESSRKEGAREPATRQDMPVRPYTALTEGVIVFTGLFVVAGLIYCIYLLHHTQNGGKSQAASARSGGGSRGSQGVGGAGGEGEVTAQLEQLEDGSMRVGKICYEPHLLLGKGSEGTVVYRGTFEGRVAAVKRVLPNSYRIAAREVQLLRSSDHHPNVIRYLCTEQCREFRYIALELCDATLEHYVEQTLDGLPPDPATDKLVLQQATRGLAHLHSLNIVHRDIKPSNVLLQLPRSGAGAWRDASTSEVTGLRVLISDFGLCKQLEAGHGSFTKHSGVTGTDGWIAPEMIRLDLEDQRPTRAVDVFSLGCLYYYVVTGGQHPYGPCITRQGNIAAGLNDLSGTSDACLTDLLGAMLSKRPQARPPARAVLKHPFFWDSATTLNFLVDVSDRVDKFPNDAASCLLEQNSESVAGQWVSKMHPEVYKDLRIHRDYRDSSVRDLLRAIRNKRTHYQELHPTVQAVMGAVPVEFLHYWTSRFPLLVHHTWRAMHCCRHDHAFAKYYPSKHVFHDLSAPDLVSDSELEGSSEAHADFTVGSRPRPTGISQGLNREYSTSRLGSKSFRTYNQKKAKQQYQQQMRIADPYQSAFNKAIDSSWRNPSSASASTETPSAGSANAPWVLRRKRASVASSPSDANTPPPNREVVPGSLLNQAPQQFPHSKNQHNDSFLPDVDEDTIDDSNSGESYEDESADRGYLSNDMQRNGTEKGELNFIPRRPSFRDSLSPSGDDCNPCLGNSQQFSPSSYNSALEVTTSTRDPSSNPSSEYPSSPSALNSVSDTGQPDRVLCSDNQSRLQQEDSFLTSAEPDFETWSTAVATESWSSVPSNEPGIVNEERTNVQEHNIPSTVEPSHDISADGCFNEKPDVAQSNSPTNEPSISNSSGVSLPPNRRVRNRKNKNR
ncbi:serine/threonine-protein kinase/endoribonuclease IRE1 [Hyalella azteca]|uniref:non-specific serine/threonine protein kinase n=1 Tax=Hyalella azteca TaxID=294128 RepID=A0A8B7PIT9_HYAAZ|nr:serine/threonine-protein kinase/endoribonuclease IRE1 [Hyalella azteca]